MKSHIMLLLSILLIQPCFAQDTERQRIGYRGLVLPEARGVPKWSVNNSVIQESVRGDLFVIETNVNPGERQAVAVYAWAQPLAAIDGRWEPRGDVYRIPSSQLGKVWGYESKKFRSAGSFTFTSNNSKSKEQQEVQVFFPYLAMQLPNGQNIEIKYEVAITINNEFIDRFFIDRTFKRIVLQVPGIFEELTVAAQDKMLEFKLINTKPDSRDAPGV